MNVQATAQATLTPVIRYDVIDNRTGAVVGTANTRARANHSADYGRDQLHKIIETIKR